MGNKLLRKYLGERKKIKLEKKNKRASIKL